MSRKGDGFTGFPSRLATQGQEVMATSQGRPSSKGSGLVQDPGEGLIILSVAARACQEMRGMVLPLNPLDTTETAHPSQE